MTSSVCSIEGCEKKVQARGWCVNHYMRWHRNGRSGDGGALIQLGRELPDAALWALRVVPSDGCWGWSGAVSSSGYGRIRHLYAHRIAYAVCFGDPGEFEVCLTCDNPICSRPDHLFLGTHAENMRDSAAKVRASGGPLFHGRPCSCGAHRDYPFLVSKKEAAL